MAFANIRQPTGSAPYVRGYLFGKTLPNNRENLKRMNSLIRHEKRSGVDMWGVSSTPLIEYAGVPLASAPSAARLNFKEYLLEKIQKLEGSAPLKVLDIGGHTFTQWKEVAMLPNLEIQGTSLTSTFVEPSMLPIVKICCAHELHKFFPKGYFDIVVSHYGVHGQERDALENALYVAKPDGEVLFSGEGNFYGLYQLGHFTKENPLHEKLFNILAYVDGKGYDGGLWFCHLKKKIDAPLDELLHSMQKNSLFGKLKLVLGQMNQF